MKDALLNDGLITFGSYPRWMTHRYFNQKVINWIAVSSFLGGLELLFSHIRIVPTKKSAAHLLSLFISLLQQNSDKFSRFFRREACPSVLERDRSCSI
ncbi:hypothetical protein ACN38_g11569 [Penicillium nordicum]|uniref:Uncharacterized protein n=1 Tax=Penicillium nordicum TaxID=229535 RepID=A0A0M8NYK3_9EURO|nr:hypothetical protein ACN38_g11569 [Penicillium nordicum]